MLAAPHEPPRVHRFGRFTPAGETRAGLAGGRAGPSNYERRSKDLQGYAKRHYTREDIDTLLGRQRIDVRARSLDEYKGCLALRVH